MNRRYPPPYDYNGYYPPHRPEPDDFTPDNIPHHEPPFVPHADWPHNIHPRWNDSEPAIVQPWWRDCCDHGEDDCICVTSADYDRWNTLVDLSALSAFNPDDLSAALSAYERLDNYSALEDAAGCVSANSGLWNSAGFVPNIYENLSAICSALDEKFNKSDWSGVYTDPTEIQGTGEPKRPLHLSPEVRALLAYVDASVNSGTGPLLNTDDYSKLSAQIQFNASKNVYQDMALSAIYDMLKLLIGDVHEATNQWVLKYNGGTDPTKFYYWDSNDPNWGK